MNVPRRELSLHARVELTACTPHRLSGRCMPAHAWLLSLPLLIMVMHRMVVVFATRRGGTALAVTPGAAVSITWLRPLKGGVPGLASKLREFLRAIGPSDAVIFGVDPGSAEAEVCQKLAGEDARVRLVQVEPGCLPNPKVAKLSQMVPEGRTEFWAVLDAEAEVDGEFVAGFRSELEGAGTDVVTVGYRFTGARTVLEWLDVLPSIQTLWPGLRLVQKFGEIGWTLGACTGFRPECIDLIGGWGALGDRLAEDHHFGWLLHRAGRRIRLSQQVLPLQADPLTLVEYWRHQRRLAITYRVATPWGALGMILPRGFFLTLTLAAILPSYFSAGLVGFAALIHLAAVGHEAILLGYRLGPWILLSLVADVVESLCWVLSWASRRVWWGGRWRAITWTGRIKEAR
jgi:hypothetical protein